MTLGFTYNPAGQIAGNTRSNDAYAWTSHYTLNRAYTANGLNRYIAITGSTTPTYDGRGNLTSANTATYGYNSGNMLTSASGGATLSYDPMQRLYETVGGGVTTRMAYDGATLIAEYNASNTLLRRYVHGPGVDEPLVWYEGTGTSDRRWLHADERGSIVAVSNASGAVTNVNAYDEYGIPRPTNVGRFQYTGQQWIAELGLYHYRARIYSPTLGRFLQTDPIGYGDGMNFYAYVRNDPVNFTDPSGLGCDTADLEPVEIEVCGPRPGAPGGGGGGNPNIPPNILINEDPARICPGVRRNGTNIDIIGTVEFFFGDFAPSAPDRTIVLPGTVPLEDQNTFVGMMNGWWTRQVGRYSVTTRMSPGPGMLTAYIGNPGEGGGRAEVGGGIMWLRPLQPATGDPVYRLNDARLVGHEFGHTLGNNHPPPGTDSGIMNRRSDGDPLESHIATLLELCRLAGE